MLRQGSWASWAKGTYVGPGRLRMQLPDLQAPGVRGSEEAEPGTGTRALLPPGPRWTLAPAVSAVLGRGSRQSQVSVQFLKTPTKRTEILSCTHRIPKAGPGL